MSLDQEPAVEADVTSADDRTLRDEELADLVDVEPSPARVTFATQDLSIDGLVKRLNRKSMLVPQFGGLVPDLHCEEARSGLKMGPCWPQTPLLYGPR